MGKSPFKQFLHKYDTRYEEAIKGLYIDVMKSVTGRTMSKAVQKFLEITKTWHEKNRYNFKPYPNYRKLILKFNKR